MKVIISEMTPKGMTSHTYDVDGISKPIISLGRQPGSDLQFANNFVSRNHARIYKEKGQWVIEDLGSSYGIYHNGQRVKKKGLHNGVVITIPDDKGQVIAELRFEGEAAPDQVKETTNAIVSSNERLQREVSMVSRAVTDSNRVQRVSIDKQGYVEEETLYNATISKMALIPRGVISLIYFIMVIVLVVQINQALNGNMISAWNTYEALDNWWLYPVYFVAGLLYLLFKESVSGQACLIMGCLLLIIVFMLPSVLETLTARLSYTNQHVRAHRRSFPWGIVTDVFGSDYNIPLDRLDNVVYVKGLMGLIFNYGTVYCYTGVRFYRIPFVKNGEDYVAKLMTETDRYKRELVSK